MKFEAPRHCQQKRQQRCGESAGSGSDGVVLDSPVKYGILNPKTTLKATDSDPYVNVHITTLASDQPVVQLHEVPTLNRKLLQLASR
jgi:hypothetical protein